MGRDLDVVIYARGLRAQGWTLKAIGQEIGCSRNKARLDTDLSYRLKSVRAARAWNDDASNRARHGQMKRAYYSANKPAFKENQARWRTNNPVRAAEKASQYSRDRRARRRYNAEGHISCDELNRRRDFWGDRCAYCFANIPEGALEWDHVVPLSAGGPHSVANLVPTCRPCNRSKHAKTLAQWLWPERT